jgi:hypothetical protein
MKGGLMAMTYAEPASAAAGRVKWNQMLSVEGEQEVDAVTPACPEDVSWA